MNPAAVKPKRGLKNSTAILVLLAWIAILLGGVYNRQNIIDWWRLKHYQAPAAVAQLASDDTMTSYARKVMYVNRPQLQPKEQFNGCNLGREQAAVLGCYKSDQDGIYVLTVQDSRLQGVEQVTAAHEMLHAAYDRLSAHEKQHINALLEDYYQHGLHDQTILDQMASYKQTEPNDVVNEMHSVFGSEVANLPAALEQYYQRYFTNRSKVTAYYATYQAEFTTRQATIKADDEHLAALKTQIDTTQADLKTRYALLQAQQSQLESYRANGNISTYNAGVSGYNALVNAYNAQVARLKSLISQYNQLVTARNAVAAETEQLANEITSNPVPIKQ